MYRMVCMVLDFILEQKIEAYTSVASMRRSKTPFSDEEQHYMIQGVRKFGVGQWAKILEHYNFHPCRTNVAIKDKFRTMKKQGFF